VALLSLAQGTDWKKVDALPGVDFSGLSKSQRGRGAGGASHEPCACGCAMKVAECRVHDPACGVSRRLAAFAVRDAASGNRKRRFAPISTVRQAAASAAGTRGEALDRRRAI